MDDIDDNAEDDPLIPPTGDRVWRRSFCLSAVVCRSFIDEAANDETFQSLHAKILPWLHTVGAENELEGWEATMLTKPLGSLDARTRVDAGWMSEALVPLAWALDRIEFPPHDVCVDPKGLTDALGFLQPNARAARGDSLRDKSAIEYQAEQAFAIHWRLRNFSLDHQQMDFGTFAKTSWFGPLNIEGLPLIDGDLSIKGKRLRETTEQEFRAALSTAQERHRGFNWLNGWDPVFSEVDTST